jgi:long-chain fatty acid transport protein
MQVFHLAIMPPFHRKSKQQMKKQDAARLLLALAVTGVPSAGWANGLRLASQDGFATARGEAFVATADNTSAIYYNPAGLTQGAGTSLRAGLYGLYYDPTFRPPAGAPNHDTTYHIENKLAGVPQFFVARTPESFPLSFGLGVYSPFGLGTSWPNDTGFRTVALEGALTYATIAPVVALELLPGLSVGGGLMVNYGNIFLKQGLLRSETPFANYFEFEGDGWSVGYNLGFLWQPHEKWSLGGTFRSAATIHMEGHTDFEQEPIIPDSRLPARAEFTFPLSAVVGVSYRPTPRWNLEFNADYTDWSSFGTATIRQASPPPFPMRQNIDVILDWRPTWMYAVGATRYFDRGWHVSGGYVYSGNAVPDAYYTPLAADLNRHFITAGVGFKGARYSLDVAYQFGHGPARTVTGSSPSSQPAQFAGQTADGTYRFRSHAVLLTLGMQF